MSAYTQPQIASGLTLLCANYQHEGLSLDLHGCHDEDGYEVNDIALAGTTVSLFELTPIETLENLSRRLDFLLPNGPQLRQASRDEQRVERAQWLLAA